ncbi:hypothetical protein LKD70_15795, partial [Ruminococcus sp. CLA-AA-H200]
CGFSGQRPEPSENFSMSISAIFKVLLSLIFSAQFFIDHLTLPNAFPLHFAKFSLHNQNTIAKFSCQYILQSFLVKASKSKISEGTLVG